jgi:hypothetical protein
LTRLPGIRLAELRFVSIPVDIELKWDVVEVAKDNSGPETYVDDSRVRDTLIVQTRHPSFQFRLVRDPESKVIESDAAFIELTACSGAVVSHDGHADTRRVDHRSNLDRLISSLVYHRESEDVLPPAAACSQSETVRSTCEIPMSFGIPGTPRWQVNATSRQVDCTSEGGAAWRLCRLPDATGDMPPSNPAVFYTSNLPYIVVHVLAAIWVVGRTRKAVTRGSSARA